VQLELLGAASRHSGVSEQISIQFAHINECFHPKTPLTILRGEHRRNYRQWHLEKIHLNPNEIKEKKTIHRLFW
jgi:hypothetical protein